MGTSIAGLPHPDRPAGGAGRQVLNENVSAREEGDRGCAVLRDPLMFKVNDSLDRFSHTKWLEAPRTSASYLACEIADLETLNLDDPSAQIGQLSSGEWRRDRLARALPRLILREGMLALTPTPGSIPIRATFRIGSPSATTGDASRAAAVRLGREDVFCGRDLIRCKMHVNAYFVSFIG